MTDQTNAGAGDNQNTTSQTANNTAGADDTGKGKGGEGDGKTIPVESYKIVADKLRDAQAKLDAIEKAAADEKQRQLTEQGKFKELADQKDAELQRLKTQFESTAKTSAIKVAALAAGTVDADAVAALVKMDQIKVSEDGTVDQDSVNKAIETLKGEKAYLFGKQAAANIGQSGGNPSGNNADTVKSFKRSQLQDSKFYAENEKDILAAAAAGKIIDDITPR